MSIYLKFGLFFLATILFGALCPAKPQDPAKNSLVAIYYPPYIDKDEKGLGKGIFVKVGVEVGKRLGLSETTVQVLPPKRSRIRILNDEDAILLSSRAYFAPAEQEKLIFIPAFPISLALIGDSEKIEKLDGLKNLRGKTVGMISGESFQLAFLKQHNAVAVEVRSVEHIIKMLHQNRIDFGLCIPLSCHEILREHFPTDTRKFNYSKYIVLTSSADFILKKSKDNVLLAKKITTVLSELKKDKNSTLHQLL